MKIAHIGLGGMGKTVLNIAGNRDHEAVAQINKDDIFDLKDCDIAIECTVPQAFFPNLEKILKAKKNVLVITTGWYDDMEKIKKMVEEADIKFMWSANYSIGVNIYYKIIESASKLINKAEEYDVWGTEIHHKNKVDSPSGTAKILENILLENIHRKTKVVEDKLDRKIADNEIHFSSTRGGLVNFGHTIGFDSEADCIKIEHFARNRDGYALGAVKCAEWLNTQKPGFYSMEDYLSEIFNR